MTRKYLLVAAVIAGLTLAGLTLAGAQTPKELPPGSPALMQPEQLVKALQGSSKPTILYVGPRFLYAQAHIKGAEFVGPASDPKSIDNLRARVAALPKSNAIVVYCGCCPWDHCPNIRPAYKELQKSGFTNVKALYLATSFGEDWAAKGYPTDKGE